MNRRKAKAFTLVELLVVITILALLVMLLMPSISTAWASAQATQCKRNLATLYEAAGVRRADRGEVLLVHDAWIGSLAPYVEGRTEVFLCPQAIAWGTSKGAVQYDGTLLTSDNDGSDTGGTGGSGGTGGAGGTGGSGGGTGTPNEGGPPTDYGVEIAFDVYSNAQFTNFLWTVGLDSPWCDAFSEGNNRWRYQIEDQGYNGGGDNDRRDIVVAVTYDEYNRPEQLEIIQPKNGSQGYRFDLMVDGEVALHNIDDHRGKSVKFEMDNDPSGAGGGGGTSGTGVGGYGGDGAVSGLGGYWQGNTYHLPGGKPLLCDYGMSRGWYMNTLAQATKVDGRLIFLLDFPRKIANFTDEPGSDKIYWDKYFIADPERWLRTYGSGNDSNEWRRYQSLRHFETANVVFCDGHIESLSASELHQTNPIWQYGR
jgi:prepilin-type N-terminal cleavage/methylation domain-containing protein/prepilin-type processing-associated H-X9-DG protein